MDRNKAIEVLKDFWSVYEIGTEIREAFETLIPELKENEDERIRKAIFKALSKKDARTVLSKQGIQVSDALDRLEKQGSQNIANSAKTCKGEQKFKVGDKIRRKTPHRYDKDMQVARVESNYYLCNHLGKFSSESISFSEESNYELVEHNPTWSEEDEKMIEFWNLYYEHKVGDMPNKDVVESLEKFRDWLKSLKERHAWKPSDEQMECLLNAEGVLRADSRIAMAQKLSSLYNDLKKLKG